MPKKPAKKICSRCTKKGARRAGALWRCRGCGRDVCEHFCGAKTRDGGATCTSCSLNEQNALRQQGALAIVAKAARRTPISKAKPSARIPGLWDPQPDDPVFLDPESDDTVLFWKRVYDRTLIQAEKVIEALKAGKISQKQYDTELEKLAKTRIEATKAMESAWNDIRKENVKNAPVINMMLNHRLGAQSRRVRHLDPPPKKRRLKKP